MVRQNELVDLVQPEMKMENSGYGQIAVGETLVDPHVIVEMDLVYGNARWVLNPSQVEEIELDLIEVVDLHMNVENADLVQPEMKTKDPGYGQIVAGETLVDPHVIVEMDLVYGNARWMLNPSQEIELDLIEVVDLHLNDENAGLGQIEPSHSS